MTSPWMQEAMRDARCRKDREDDEAFNAHQRERLEAARSHDEAQARREVCSFQHFDTLRKRVAQANFESETERRIFLEDCDAAAAVPAAYPSPDDSAGGFAYP